MSVTSKSLDSLDGYMERALRAEIERRANKMFEDYKKELIEKLDKSKAEAVAGVVIHIMSLVRIEQLTNELVIRVETPGKEKL